MPFATNKLKKTFILHIVDTQLMLLRNEKYIVLRNSFNFPVKRLHPLSFNAYLMALVIFIFKTGKINDIPKRLCERILLNSKGDNQLSALCALHYKYIQKKKTIIRGVSPQWRLNPTHKVLIRDDVSLCVCTRAGNSL